MRFACGGRVVAVWLLQRGNGTIRMSNMAEMISSRADVPKLALGEAWAGGGGGASSTSLLTSYPWPSSIDGPFSFTCEFEIKGTHHVCPHNRACATLPWILHGDPIAVHRTCSRIECTER